MFITAIGCDQRDTTLGKMIESCGSRLRRFDRLGHLVEQANRDGHITREEAVALVHRFDHEFPKKHFKEFLEYLGISEAHYWDVVKLFPDEPSLIV